MSVKLHEIMSAARARSASLAAEVAGYLVLATADQIAGAPRGLGFGDVTLSEEGQVRIAGGQPVDDAQAEQTLRSMLGTMLLEASSVTPGLSRVGHKASGGGLDVLIREIEVALVPVNRAAARRALARLYRDVDRARHAGRMADWQPPPCSAAPNLPVQEVPVPQALAAPTASAARAPSPPALIPTDEVELSAMLSRESAPPAVPERDESWRSPGAGAVADLDWPDEHVAVDDDELLTAIPVFVEALRVETPLPSVPTVPDLEVPACEALPAHRRGSLEPVTVPAPLVAPAPPRAADRPEPSGTSRTPVFGSNLGVLELSAPLEISQVTPAVLALAGDDATERMPSVIEDDLDVEQALAGVSAAFADPRRTVDGLETEDPPPARGEEPSVEPPLQAARTPSPAPQPVSPREALSRLALRPERPARNDYAPPRYAPRRSDVSALLSGFGVATVKSERDLCSDLKALAGVDETAPPPLVELSETPPPVAVSEVRRTEAPAAAEGGGSSARVVAGAASLGLLIAGFGFGSIPNRHAAESSPGAGVPAVESMAESARVPCSAELTVRQVPAKSRTRVRAGGDGSVIAPSRVVGTDAVFEGLECGQSAEVTVELPGRSRWVRIPVAADSLSPSAEAPGLVRYTVALR